MSSDDASQTPSASRASAGALWAGAVGSGMVDLVELLLPLWAGVGLALTATGAGVLAAMIPLGSLAGRPLAGRLVDSGHRAAPLAGGLATSAAGALTLAAVSAPVPAAMGALLIGVGVGLGFIATMALVADSGSEADRAGGAFAELFAWESRGTLVALVVGVFLASAVGYRTTFAAMGGVCLITCLVVARRPQRRPRPSPSRTRDGAGARRSGLGVVWLTALAQQMVILVAMLRLQRNGGLDLPMVSLLMLPGLIVFAMAGPLFTTLTRGRRPERVLPMCYLTVAAGALVMAVEPMAVGVAVGWCVAASGIALLVPLQRSVVTSGDQPLGQALGRYGITVLVGSSTGAVGAGYTYTHLPWPAVCGGIAVLLVAAAAAAYVTQRATPT